MDSFNPSIYISTTRWGEILWTKKLALWNSLKHSFYSMLLPVQLWFWLIILEILFLVCNIGILVLITLVSTDFISEYSNMEGNRNKQEIFPHPFSCNQKFITKQVGKNRRDFPISKRIISIGVKRNESYRLMQRYLVANLHSFLSAGFVILFWWWIWETKKTADNVITWFFYFSLLRIYWPGFSIDMQEKCPHEMVWLLYSLVFFTFFSFVFGMKIWRLYVSDLKTPKLGHKS